MSALSPNDCAALEAILVRILSNDNLDRPAAVAAYTSSLQASPSPVLSGLVLLARESQVPGVPTLCAVLLRQALRGPFPEGVLCNCLSAPPSAPPAGQDASRIGVGLPPGSVASPGCALHGAVHGPVAQSGIGAHWPGMDAEARNACTEGLLELACSESVHRGLRIRLCDVVAASGLAMLSVGLWPELVPLLVALAAPGGSPVPRASAIRILGTIAQELGLEALLRSATMAAGYNPREHGDRQRQLMRTLGADTIRAVAEGLGERDTIVALESVHAAARLMMATYDETPALGERAIAHYRQHEHRVRNHGMGHRAQQHGGGHHRHAASAAAAAAAAANSNSKNDTNIIEGDNDSAQAMMSGGMSTFSASSSPSSPSAPPSSSAAAAAASAAAPGLMKLFPEALERELQEAVSSLCVPAVEALHRITGEDEFAALEPLEDLVEAVGRAQGAFRSSFSEVALGVFQLAAADSLDESLRHLAVEFLVLLAEMYPGRARREPGFASQVLGLLLSMLSTVHGSPRWFDGVDGDEAGDADDGDPEAVEVAEEALDRFALALGGKTVVEAAQPILRDRLASEQWADRHAALMALSNLAEGCARQFAQDLPAVVAIATTNLSDPHPRVRWAAINAIGQLCHDLAPAVQQQHGDVVLPALCRAMAENAQFPRVQAYAARSTVNFLERCPAHLLVPVIPDVLASLIPLLTGVAAAAAAAAGAAGAAGRGSSDGNGDGGSDPQLTAVHGSPYPRREALTALAALANAAGVHFSAYYSSVMPGLIEMLEQGHDAADYDNIQPGAHITRIGNRVVVGTPAPPGSPASIQAGVTWGRALECAAFVGASVGAEIFAGDAVRIIEAVRAHPPARAESRLTVLAMRSVARIAGTLGPAFAPYLPGVMEDLVEMAAQEVSLEVGEGRCLLYFYGFLFTNLNLKYVYKKNRVWHPSFLR
jgi:hypothetical protein